MHNRYIYNLKQDLLPLAIGEKAKNLRKVHDMRQNVPNSFCCTWEALQDFNDSGEQVLQQLREEASLLLDSSKSYAVRSSADIEDHHEVSYAGQFISILDVRGVDAIVNSIQEVWKSAETQSLKIYQEAVEDSGNPAKMAVIVQEMVSPHLSGVVFSRNPITGLDETIIEAVEGPGTKLLQDGHTPFRWVNRWDRWHEKPAGIPDYEEPIQEVLDRTKKIVEAYGRDLDLEWVYDGKEIYWLQLREITALKDIHIYSNRISKEFLPGMIKPLVWSVNVPLVNGAWLELISEVIGQIDIEPESLAHSFYYRAYFDTSTFGKIFDLLGMPRQALEINMGIIERPEEEPAFRPNRKMVKLLPKLLAFLYDKWRFSRKVEQRFPLIESKYMAISDKQIDALGQDELLEEIDGLKAVTKEAAYYNIVVPLLMYAYTGALRNQLEKCQVDFEEFDLTRNLTSLDNYAPDINLELLQFEFSSLDSETQEEISTNDYASFMKMDKVEPFRSNVGRFMEQFGHLSDSGNDFSVAPWREDPDLILSLITSYQPTSGSRAAKIGYEDLQLPILRRWLMGFFYRRARRFRYLRERVSSNYTFGYGLFRPYFLALGERFMDDGLLRNREDVFYLYEDEIRQLAAGNNNRESVEERIAHRKLEMSAYQDIELPEIIYGDDPPPPMPPTSEFLQGTPTSRGVYTGRATVVRGLKDFSKVNPGDVIFIPYSDVGWTPLFSKAGAIVAESGGILSHSSIVAREYNLPAVVSVPNACSIIDNTIVTVDGYRGEVLIHESGSLEVNKSRHLPESNLE